MFSKILIFYLFLFYNNVLLTEQLVCYTCFNTSTILSSECLKTECYESINSKPVCQVCIYSLFFEIFFSKYFIVYSSI